MFLVKDDMIERHSRIRRYLTASDPVAALFLAAADLEWTINRAIIAGGSDTNAAIHDALEKCRGLKGYEKLWEKQVLPRTSSTLGEVITSWKLVDTAFFLRNKLIHSVKTTTGPGYLRKMVEAPLAASLALSDFFTARGINLYDRLPVRRKRTNAKLVCVA